MRFSFKQAVSQSYLYFPHFLWTILLSCHCLPGQNTCFIYGCCCACFNNIVFGRATILGRNFSMQPVHFVQISLIKSNQNSHHSTGQWISSVSLVLSKQKENHEGLDNLFLSGKHIQCWLSFIINLTHAILKKGAQLRKLLHQIGLWFIFFFDNTGRSSCNYLG